MAHKVFEGKDGQWYFNVQAANGQIVAQSEGYVSKGNAERGYHALLDAVHADVLAELRAGTIVEDTAMRDEGDMLAGDAAGPGPLCEALANVSAAESAVRADGRRGRRSKL